MPRITQARRREREDRILTAAAACFARNGIHATTVRDICTEAEVSVGGVYTHFGGKEAIVETLIEGGRAKVASMVDRFEAEPHLDAALAGLFDAITGPRTGPERNQAARLEVRIWGEAAGEDPVAVALRARFDELLTAVRARIATRVPKQEAETRARLFLGAVQGFLAQQLLGPGSRVEDYRDATVQAAIR